LEKAGKSTLASWKKKRVLLKLVTKKEAKENETEKGEFAMFSWSGGGGGDNFYVGKKKRGSLVHRTVMGGARLKKGMSAPAHCLRP